MVALEVYMFFTFPFKVTFVSKIKTEKPQLLLKTGSNQIFG